MKTLHFKVKGNPEPKLAKIFSMFLNAMGEQILNGDECVRLYDRFVWLLPKLDSATMMSEIVETFASHAEVDIKEE